MIAKERMTGAYRLSAYYLAKSASELPLHVICPIPFYSFAFWMAGLGGVSEYFATLAVLILVAVTAQVRMHKHVAMLVVDGKLYPLSPLIIVKEHLQLSE